MYTIFKEIKDSTVDFIFDTPYYLPIKDFFDCDPRVRTQNGFIPYPKILSDTIKANCILDLTAADQIGLTLRPYEAVVYNRKLLTNNKAILSFKYYDHRYMKYFSKVEDIDWDWEKSVSQ